MGILFALNVEQDLDQQKNRGIKMWSAIKQVTQIIWRFLRGKEFIDLGNPFEEVRRRPEVKLPWVDPIDFQSTGMSYKCWGCNRGEYLPMVPSPSQEDMTSFWRRWGSVEESKKIIFQGDGSYIAESFCPECQKILEAEAKPFKFGYLASDLFVLFKQQSQGTLH